MELFPVGLPFSLGLCGLTLLSISHGVVVGVVICYLDVFPFFHVAFPEHSAMATGILIG